MTHTNLSMPVDHATLTLADGAYNAGRIAGVALLAIIIIVFAIRKFGASRSKR